MEERSFFTAFENAKYLCYFLAVNGSFWCNAAARLQPDEARKATCNLLAEIARENVGREEAYIPPLLADALQLQGMVVLPTENGLLAFVLRPSESPILALSAQLREPVTDIFSLLPSLANHLDGDADPKLLVSMQQNSYRLLRVASNLENVALVQRPAYSTQTIDVNALVVSVCAAANGVCSEQDVEIQWQTPEAPVPVLCNLRQLTEALLNIIRNSLQYTRDGNRIQVRLTVAATQAAITVEDRGLGIRPEYIQRIFEPYFSVDPYGDSRERPGLGLGLAVVQEMARRVGGRVGAESRYGEGSRVTLSLPVAANDENALGSGPIDYVSNHYSSLYMQLCGYCRLPDITPPK